MKRKKRFGLIFVLSLSILVIAVQIVATIQTDAGNSIPETQLIAEVVSPDSTEVYESPKATANVLGNAEKGEAYAVNADYSDETWYEIVYEEKTGYVEKDNMSLSQASTASGVPVKTSEPVKTMDEPVDTLDVSNTLAEPVVTTGVLRTYIPSDSDIPDKADESPAPNENPEPSESPAPSETSEPFEVPEPVSTPAPSDDGDVDPDSWYTINNAQFDIDSTGKNARETTDGINEALSWAKGQGYSKIKFSEGTYLIQCDWNNRYIAPTDGILVPSGLMLDLGSSTFKMKTNNYPAYCIFGIVNKRNVTIKNGKLIGDLDNHVFAPSGSSSTHEWGFGICVSASTNVTIEGVTIKKTTGDGIILEGSYEPLSSGGKVSSKVKISNCDISNCRRQGISVVGSTDSEIKGNKIYNIRGTDPQYGIDVEPEFDYPVDNLKIHGNTIYGCSGGAITCCKGSNYEVYDNKCTDNNIIAVFSSNVKIYENTIEDTFIRVMPEAKNVTVYDNILEGNSWTFNG